jgi:peptidyl-prolyl cis-trans isomerase B (cyclophilin B)
MNLRRNKDRAGLQTLQEKLVVDSKEKCKEMGIPEFTAEQVETYTKIGGTPYLDNQYTVFGEVESGLDVVEKIQNCETARNDRPKTDISMTVEVI